MRGRVGEGVRAARLCRGADPLTNPPPKAGEGMANGAVVCHWRSLPDRLHLAGDRDGGRGLVVGDDDLVLVAVLDAPLAADERSLGDVLGRKGRQVRAI